MSGEDPQSSRPVSSTNEVRSEQKGISKSSSSSLSMVKDTNDDYNVKSILTLDREKSLRGRVLPRNLKKIDGKSIDIDLRGFPANLQFTLGGKRGNVVCSSKIPTVLKSWRVVAVNGKYGLTGKALEAEIASVRHKYRKFTVTFSFGNVDEEEEEMERQRLLAEEELRKAAEQEAKARVKAEREEVARLKAEQEAAARLNAEQEKAARLKAEQEEAARLKAEQEEVARLKAEQEEAARLKAEQEEVARLKAEQEEIARLKAEHEEAARLKAEQEEVTRLKAEQVEVARLKAEQEEAARLKAEQEEVARLKAEQEEAARLKAEEDETARLKAEQEEIARLKAEQEEAARLKAEQEAKAREKAEREEAARLKAEQEDAARLKAEQEEVARLKAEQEEAARLKAEQEEVARLKAEQEEAARLKAWQEEAARLKAEQEALVRANAELQRKAAEKRKADEAVAKKIASDIKKIEEKTGLPQRDSVQDPTAVLFSAMTKKNSSSVDKAPKKSGPCDKCDGDHHESQCPYFKNKARLKHRDATDMYDKKKAQKSGCASAVCDDDEKPLVYTSKEVSVTSQPGDGNCLFHSLSYGLRRSRSTSGRGETAPALRMELEDYIAAHPHDEISDTPLSDYILWDSQSSVKAYTNRMRVGNDWGGAIEIAICARIKNVEIHVYEKRGSNFVRISKFDCGDSGGNPKILNILYGGRCHYDALDIR